MAKIKINSKMRLTIIYVVAFSVFGGIAWFFINSIGFGYQSVRHILYGEDIGFIVDSTYQIPCVDDGRPAYCWEADFSNKILNHKEIGISTRLDCYHDESPVKIGDSATFSYDKYSNTYKYNFNNFIDRTISYLDVVPFFVAVSLALWIVFQQVQSLLVLIKKSWGSPLNAVTVSKKINLIASQIAIAISIVIIYIKIASIVFSKFADSAFLLGLSLLAFIVIISLNFIGIVVKAIDVANENTLAGKMYQISQNTIKVTTFAMIFILAISRIWHVCLLSDGKDIDAAQLLNPLSKIFEIVKLFVSNNK